MTTPPGWEGILDQGETILWQGRPDARVVFRPGNVVTFLFGLGFAAFAFFWMVMASQAGGFLWMFGLLHFAVGIGLAFGAMFWSSWRRRHSWYTLTNKRAFIATDTPFRGRTLRSYPIGPTTVLEFRDRDPASILFDHEMRRGKNGSYQVAIGFERIENGAEVYRMMREIQERQRA